MKLRKLISAFLIIFTFVFILSHLVNLLSYRPSEKYAADVYLDTASHKKALVLVAHDDDAVTFAGTLAKLRENGWKVDYACFYSADKGVKFDLIRKAEAEKASHIQGFNRTWLIDFKMLKDPDSLARPKYMPVPYDSFPLHYKYDSLYQIISDIVLASNPTVIFSLDDVMGGYGHSEHVMVGQLAIKVARDLNASGLAKVQKSYQLVYPNSLEAKINTGNRVYEAAKVIYKADGMPEPNVQIDIYKHSKEKKDVLLAYSSQQKNLKKFIIGYHLFPHWLYFRVFDREFFRVVDIG